MHLCCIRARGKSEYTMVYVGLRMDFTHPERGFCFDMLPDSVLHSRPLVELSSHHLISCLVQ